MTPRFSSAPIGMSARPGTTTALEWGGHALADLGVTILEDRTVMDVAGRRTLIAHGETACQRPAIEQRLGRNRFFVALMRSIHPDWIARIQPYTTAPVGSLNGWQQGWTKDRRLT
ncbi:MAG: hypothetical protein GEU90_16905 [Gemmatimonas sp.]|nr:hypothetical protein [Gemmatimonas sp.]